MLQSKMNNYKLVVQERSDKCSFVAVQVGRCGDTDTDLEGEWGALGGCCRLECVLWSGCGEAAMEFHLLAAIGSTGSQICRCTT
jgi:hypothetical protein